MARIKRAVLVSGLVALPLLAPAAAGAWGFEAHRLVATRAIEALPPELRPLFQANADYLAEHSLDPDLWRFAGLEGEAPNHFMDLDAFGAPPFQIERDEAAHLARHGAEARERGRLPWRVAEEHAALVAAFAGRDPAAVLRHAAVLAHYVGDAHVPLHAVLNYDGQLSGQPGAHSRWESRLVSRFQRQLEPELRPALQAPEREPLELSFTALEESFAEAEALLAHDRESVRGIDLMATAEDDRYDDGFYSRLYQGEGERLQRRMTRAAERLAALWAGAWEAAGRPELGEFRFAHVRGARRAVLLSLDGAGERLLRQGIARGVLPTLDRLRRSGATASGVVTSRPAKTAPGHATLFTGAWPARSGITSNGLLPPDAPVTSVERGFLSTRLRAEPIWVSAAREGLSACVASGTQVWPFDPYLSERRFGANFGRQLTLFDGYSAGDWPGGFSLDRHDIELSPAGEWDSAAPVAGARELALPRAGVPLQGLLFDDPEDPAAGFDTLLVAPDRDSARGVRLKPLPAGDASALQSLRLELDGEPAVVHLRLFELSSDADSLLLWASTPYSLRSNRPLAARAALEATGGFLGNAAIGDYGRGRLGPTLWQAGDGSAEERYLETAARVVERFQRLNQLCFERSEWSLLVTYLPFPDEMFHLWLGYLEPELPGHDPELARRLWPYLERALGLVDGYVAELAERLGTDGILAIGSDHGQIGSRRAVAPNRVLADAGLLATDAEGGIDLTRTRAIYHAGNSGRVLVNRDTLPGGVVPDWEVSAVLERAAAALRAARDPESGAPLFEAVRELDGELELVAAAGYDATTRADADAAAVDRPPAGVHLFGPGRDEMLASFTVSGPGVPAGVDLGRIRQVDVAPTLAALLGIGPPRDADGVPLGAALEPDWR